MFPYFLCDLKYGKIENHVCFVERRMKIIYNKICIAKIESKLAVSYCFDCINFGNGIFHFLVTVWLSINCHLSTSNRKVSHLLLQNYYVLNI